MSPVRCHLPPLLVLPMVLVPLGPTAFAQEVPAERQPAVLFAGSYWGGCGYDTASRLSESGFALGASGGLISSPLTYDRVKPYNVIVAMGLGQANADGTLSADTQQTLNTLRRFLDSGGGVLVLPFFGQMATEAPPLEELLRPLGATPLFGEMVLDPTSQVATAWRIPFGYTDAVSESPAAPGLEGLWYPTPTGRIGAQNHTTTAVLDNAWSVIVHGATSSVTRPRRRLMDNDVDMTTAGTYAESVPLVATREVGPGRLAYLGITPEYLFGGNAMTTLEGIVLERGLAGKPSGGLQLVQGLLRWLAEPSMGSAELGGAQTDPNLLRDPYQTQFGTPYSWPEEVTFPPSRPALDGVIGARTRYSTGRATADEWVAAAKANGLAFLVFLEEFAQLSPDEFAALKADCARLSGPGFWAVPGFSIDDEVGNHYFYLGPSFPYPEARFLSDDGTVLRSYDNEISPDDPHVPGQLAMTTLNYAYSVSAFKLTAGNFLFSQDAAPFAGFFSDWNAMGVITERAGEVVEDATEDYLCLVDSGQGPQPLAIHLMDDPAQLGQTRWRTVLRLPTEGGGLIAGTVKPESLVSDYFSLWHFYPDNPSAIYLTSGPQIESWSYTGPRDYEGSSPGDFVWQNHRWVLHGRVTSDVGLSEVAVYDGPQLFRRFLPGGAEEYEFTVDGTHDRQHNLVVIATDTEGNRAVSGEQWDRNHRAEEFMCSDRNNQLSYGYLTDEHGIGIMTGGNQTLATPNKRVDGGEISPSGTFRNDALLGAPAFDGAAGGDPAVFEYFEPFGANPPAVRPNVSESLRLLHTADVHIGEGRREHVFADGVGVYNVWHTLWRTVPATDYVVTKRNHFFQIDPDSPMAVFLWRMDLRLVRDLPNSGWLAGFLRNGEERMWALRGSDGRTSVGEWEATPRSEARTLRVPFGPGAYAALLDSPLGGAAVFSLTEELEATVTPPARGRIDFTLPADSSPKQAGDTARVELLLVGIPRPTDRTRHLPTSSNEVVERFLHDYGLAGGPPAYAVVPASGTVSDARYPLRIDGGAEQCFRGHVSGTLCSSLPVLVGGLHDNWSAFLFDAAKGAARPVGVFEGAAWATLCLRGDMDLFVGHPVVADSAEVLIQVTQTGDDRWSIEVHNPTDSAVTATVQANPHFPPLAGKLPPRTLTIPPGSSERLAL